MNESQNIEYKESWRDDYLKWVCGFANAQGGRIYIGITDNGTLKGVNNSKKLQEDIPNQVRDVLGILVDVLLHSHEGKDYLELRVPQCSYPISFHGEYYYRSGATNQQLRGAALTAFLLKKRGLIGTTSLSMGYLRTTWIMKALPSSGEKLCATDV